MADWNTVISTRHGLRAASGWRLCAAVLALAAAIGCASTPRGTVPAGTAEPDKFLFDKGTDALDEKKWLTAREFFKQVTETYTRARTGRTPSSASATPTSAKARRRRWCSRSTSSRSFSRSTRPTRAPTTRSTSWRWRTSARCACRSATRPRRARRLKEFDTFVARYPNSSLMPEVKAKLREAHDRLSEADYQVGVFLLPAAVVSGRDRSLQVGAQGRSGVHRPRQRVLLPGRIAGEGEARSRGAAATRRLVEEFEQSEHLVLAQKRIAELKAQVLKPGT